jgi:translation initiation factor 2B subunit (eIF-2B alpha/beta/delta family)
MISEPAMALHMGNMALQLAKKLTIYTNGDSTMTAKLREALVQPNTRITLDSRRIASFSMKSSHASDVVLTFEDGSTVIEGFIVSASHDRPLRW